MKIFKKYFANIGTKILDIFFPLTCVICEKTGEDICEKCLFQQKVFPKKLEFSGGRRTGDSLSVSSFFLYSDEWVKKLIRKGKYQYSPEIFRLLSFFITEKISENSPELLDEIFCKNSENTILVPVPLHYFRFQKRGYNQSKIIADVFSEVSGIPVIEIVSRVKHTPPQAKCSREERKKNLENAFILSSDIVKKIEKNTHIILVDDVVSTASTLQEIQKILNINGYTNISGLALARGG